MKTNIKNFLKSIIAFVMTLTLAFSLFSCSVGSKQIDLLDFLSITYSSFNEYATPHLNVDKDAIEEAISREKLEEYFSSVSKQKYDMYKAWGESVYFDDIFQIDFAEDYSNLSNGNTITVRIAPNEELSEVGETIKSIQKGLKISFKDTEIDIKVEGLIDAQKLDLFEDIEQYISFVGASGNGKIVFTHPDDYQRQIGGFYIKKVSKYFEIIYNNKKIGSFSYKSENENLSSGTDTNIVLVLGTDTEKNLSTYGCVAKSTEYLVKTPNLGTYVNSLDDVTKEDLILLKNKFLAEHTNVNEISTYIATAKPDSVIKEKAKCKLILFAKVTHKNSWDSGSVTTTEYIELSEIIRKSDGSLEISYFNNRSTPLRWDINNPTDRLSSDYVYEKIN